MKPAHPLDAPGRKPALRERGDNRRADDPATDGGRQGVGRQTAVAQSELGFRLQTLTAKLRAAARRAARRGARVGRHAGHPGARLAAESHHAFRWRRSRDGSRTRRALVRGFHSAASGCYGPGDHHGEENCLGEVGHHHGARRAAHPLRTGCVADVRWTGTRARAAQARVPRAHRRARGASAWAV